MRKVHAVITSILAGVGDSASYCPGRQFVDGDLGVLFSSSELKTANTITCNFISSERAVAVSTLISRSTHQRVSTFHEEYATPKPFFWTRRASTCGYVQNSAGQLEI